MPKLFGLIKETGYSTNGNRSTDSPLPFAKTQPPIKITFKSEPRFAQSSCKFFSLKGLLNK